MPALILETLAAAEGPAHPAAPGPSAGGQMDEDGHAVPTAELGTPGAAPPVAWDSPREGRREEPVPAAQQGYSRYSRYSRIPCLPWSRSTRCLPPAERGGSWVSAHRGRTPGGPRHHPRSLSPIPLRLHQPLHCWGHRTACPRLSRGRCWNPPCPVPALRGPGCLLRGQTAPGRCHRCGTRLSVPAAGMLRQSRAEERSGVAVPSFPCA